MDDDERQILKLFEDGDRALMAGNITELARILADDYIQHDESGTAHSREDVLNDLRSGEIRYVSMISTGRRIRRVSQDVAVVHGSEEDDVEQGGRRFPVNYVYLDVVVKRAGRWQIVASQLVKQE